MKWYAIHTQLNRENLATYHLEKQGFDVWLPCIERTIKHARKAKRVRLPLFPGYLFVNFDPENVEWRAINGTIGVKQLVSFGKKPSALDDSFINALKANEDTAGIIQTQHCDFELGQDVKIVYGPLAGSIGKLLRMDTGNRVTVLLEMLGHLIHGQIDRDAIAGT